MRRTMIVLAVAALVHAPAAAGWSWPVDGPVLRPFVFGDDPYAAGQHRGIDIGAPHGTPVRAASSGTVSFAGTVPSSGPTVTVRTVDGHSVTYLELGTVRVVRGADVVEGDPIGTVGPAEHVHLGVRVTADPQGYRDPLLFLPARAEPPARTDPVEDLPPATAQPDPVVEPTAEAATTAIAATPGEAVAPEPDESPPAAAEPAEAPPAGVAGDSAPDAQAEAPGDAPATARVRERPVPAAETVAHRRAPAAAETTVSVARPKPVAARAKATPRPARGPAKRSRGPAKRSAEPPRARAGDSFVAAPSHEAAEGAAPVSRRHKAAVRREVRRRPVSARARLSEPPAVPRARGRAEATRRSSAWPRADLALASLGLTMLGAAAAGAAAVRRRGPKVPPGSEPSEATGRVGADCCPVGRVRAPHVLHSCARAREPGWLLSPAGERRRTAVARRPRPLPRPRRTAPAHTGT